MNPNEPTLTLPPGTRIGEYVITKVLGMGGFGITYLARDSHLDKDVAIKEYFPATVAYRDAELSVRAHTAVGTRADIYQWGLERVMDEARVLAKFDHPNLVRVLRYFEAHGTAYIVMDYVAGTCLRDLIIDQGPTAPATARGWLTALLNGLQEVHGAGVLHRDIKPANIIIKNDGTPVLIDFGAARQAMGSRAHEVTIVQSIRYTPIEQLGASGTLGPWTDIYALAATMYEALTGQQPIDCSDRVVSDGLVPLTQAVADPAEAGFLRAVDWGLAVRPDDRPQSVLAWRQALLREHTRLYPGPAPDSGATRILPNSSPPQADPPPTRARASDSGSPTPAKPAGARLAGMGVGLAICAALGLGAWFYWNRQPPQTAIAAPSPVTSPVDATDPPHAVTVDEPLASAPVDDPAIIDDPPPAPSPDEAAHYEIAEYVGYAEAYELYLRLHPDGFYTAPAKSNAGQAPRMTPPR